MSQRDLVLVVDDDPDCRELMALIVSARGYEVSEACNCCEAISLASREANRLALVLLDYFMPGITPRECSNRLRALLGDVPVVLVTAAVDASARAAELELTHFLAKPFDLADLEQLLLLADGHRDRATVTTPDGPT